MFRNLFACEEIRAVVTIGIGLTITPESCGLRVIQLLEKCKKNFDVLSEGLSLDISRRLLGLILIRMRFNIDQLYWEEAPSPPPPPITLI